MKFGVIIHVWQECVFLRYHHTRIPRGGAPASLYFVEPSTCAQMVWTRATKFGVITHGAQSLARSKLTFQPCS